jgi:DNA polymerase-3 subunit delta'
MSWMDLEGHDAVVERFRRSLSRDRLGSAYLFAGLEGIGKYSFALRLAQSLFCSGHPASALQPCGACPSCRHVIAETHPDLLVVRRPDDRNVIPIEAFIGPRERRMREGLCPWIATKPMEGSRRIAIIDDADDLAEEGANSLLKTLEEPPPRSLLILIAANLSGQLPTIRSRCQIIHFQPLAAEMVKSIIQRQGVSTDDSHAEWVARIAHGSIATARRWADPAIADFRESWYSSIVDPDQDPLRIAAQATAFMEGGGKEAPARRERLGLLIDMTSELYRQAMRAQVGAPVDADPPLLQAIRLLVKNWHHDAEAFAACMERCVAARRRLDSYAQPQTTLESWLDELSWITRDGAYASLAW